MQGVNSVIVYLLIVADGCYVSSFFRLQTQNLILGSSFLQTRHCHFKQILAYKKCELWLHEN